MNDSNVNRQPVRWGVLGLANIAITKTIPAFATASGATLVAVASRDADKSRRVARQHGIPCTHASYQALIEPVPRISRA